MAAAAAEAIMLSDIELLRPPEKSKKAKEKYWRKEEIIIHDGGNRKMATAAAPAAPAKQTDCIQRQNHIHCSTFRIIFHRQPPAAMTMAA